jgi:hypothetical protein
MAISKTELTRRIAHCIGIWETNRGGDAPAPQESKLNTVAGVAASMATIEQATMPYAVGALLDHKELRALATPPLSVDELKDADSRCKAVATLVKSVTASEVAGVKPATFIANKAELIADAGLSDADVATMFSAAALKRTIDGLNKKVANGSVTVKQAIATIKPADRLGLNEASLSSYIKKPANWGENRAGWQRKAVNAMPNSVGSRIQAVATSSNGTGIMIVVTGERLTDRLKNNPVPGTKAGLKPIVMDVAQRNNPNETNYGLNVWKNYDRLF